METDSDLLKHEILDRLKSQGADISHIKENLAVLASNSTSINEKIRHHEAQLEPLIKTYNFVQVAAKILATLGTLAALGIAGAKIAHAEAYTERVGVEIAHPDGLVRIEMADGFCSGFVAAKNIIVTAAHCAEKNETGYVVFPSGRRAKFWVLVRGIPASPTDVEILRANTGDAPSLSIADVENWPEVGMFWSFRSSVPMGYPGILMELHKEQPKGVLGKGVGQVWPGDSGSPVVGADGHVRGVVIMMQDDAPIFYFVSLPVLKKALALALANSH
jgi:hypothetical protein